jgi:arsenate reductase-like glutaredoxin family protein|tara:strand:- start:6715 stop:7374 length:660 start_codon:yes stop_codon:yes gene_type:complete
MIFPTLIVDNFFSDPYKIKTISDKLNFKKDPNGEWPGERSEQLHKVNFNLFNFINLKILSLLYPKDHHQINFTASSTFQKISKERYPHEGWVHKDNPSEITAIVYLSKHKNCGTSLWKAKDFFVPNNMDDKKYYYKKDTFDEEQLKFLKEHNNNYEKILEVDSLFNRVLIFDSNHPHSANNFVDLNVDDDRLTLITFIKKLQINNEPLKYPITECNRLG